MRNWYSLGCLLALGGLLAVACDSNGGTDAGTTPTDGGGGGTDAGPPPAGPVVGVGSSLEMLMPADFSCRGTVTAPPDTGTASSFSAVVTDFQRHVPVEGLTVQFFGDNMPSLDGSCTAPCVELVSDASGVVSEMGPEGSWFAYRIVAGMGTTPTGSGTYIGAVHINNPVPTTGGMATLNAVSDATRNTIIALLGATVETGTATLSGAIRDCNGTEVANATLRVFDSTGEIELGFGATGPRAFYFNGDPAGSLPAARQRATNIDGLFGAANIPIPTDDTVRIEAWGVLTEGGSPEMLGCETIQVVSDGISIVTMGPTRSDGPTGCSG